MTSCLWFHARYRCRHSGACCTSGWPIPVEAGQRERLELAMARGVLNSPRGGSQPFADERETPAEVRGVLRTDEHGACAFYDPGARRCAIHSALGHDALPVSCQIFPRVCLLDAAGTFVTLSHYCPTAAGLLFDDEPASQKARATSAAARAIASQKARATPAAARATSAAARATPAAARATPAAARAIASQKARATSAETPVIVEAPRCFAPMPLEGLDARGALPPLLHPRMLMDVESYHAWERTAAAMLVGEGTPEEALERAIRFTEDLRTWEPARGSLSAEVEGQSRRHLAPLHRPARARGHGALPALHARALALDELVRRAVPASLETPRQPAGAASGFARFVATSWPAFAGPVKRYLAARLFGNWCAYQGRGLRTVLCSVVAALDVVRVEAARHCASAARALDAELLADSFRSADLLLVHLASREDLARAFGAIEEGSADELAHAL